MRSTLKNFTKKNPNILIEQDIKFEYIRNPRNDDSFIIRYDKKEKIPNLSNIVLHEELIAFHDEKNEIIEFMYTLVDEKEDKECKGKKFIFNYKWDAYKCEFGKPSNHLEFFAKGFIPVKTETLSNYRQLWKFKDYYSDKTQSIVKSFFKKATPYSFYIKNFKFRANQKNEIILFLKTLNFYMSYYERKSPQIIILESQEKDKEIIKTPCYSEKEKFPKNISAVDMDLTLLDVIWVAHWTSNIRQKFMFYFQVIEYIWYYYLDNDKKNKIKKILLNPDIWDNTEKYLMQIIDTISNNNKNQKDFSVEKFKLVINPYCNFSDIEAEINENKNFFVKKVKFQWDLEIDAVFENNSSSKTEYSDKEFEKIIHNLWKIRNTLVHLREVREDKVILPGKKNDELIKPYLFIIRRLAEKMAIWFKKI